MKIKKLVIGFVIALSAALALNAVSKTTPRGNNSETSNEHQTFLVTDTN
jgi:hypothetical protein